MKKERKYRIDFVVSSILLCAVVGCNLDIGSVARYSNSSVKSVVSKVIDEEMSTIKDNLEPELQAGIENGTSKDGSPLSGSEIVELTSLEDDGDKYIGFCYEVERTTSSCLSEDVLNLAQELIPQADYVELVDKVAKTEKTLETIGNEMAKGIPVDQQEAFYKDLKTLVVRSVVLLTAGIVYAVMPNTVFWGKVSAAAAISVGAGMVAIAVMTIYQYFKFGPSEGSAAKTFEEWIKEILNDSKAEFALTTAVTSIGNSLNKGPVVTGIIMCAFAVFKATELIRTMLVTYNFNA